MPGPVSDSYDPEFGTSSNADVVREALQDVRDRITEHLGEQRLPIVEVAMGPAGVLCTPDLRERDLRLIRFALDRTIADV